MDGLALSVFSHQEGDNHDFSLAFQYEICLFERGNEKMEGLGLEYGGFQQ